MPDSIFDRLQNKIDVAKREEGISAIELTDLPPNLRKVMRLMLREVAMKRTEIDAAIEAMPPANRLAPQELSEALDKLVEQNWLSRYGSDDMTTYRVNLRRRAGSKLSTDIWGALDGKIAAGQARSKPENSEDQN
jgi:hypothetical protein